MAIVFISPKATQREFFKTIATILALVFFVFILTFSIMLFLSSNKNMGQLPAVGSKNISIDFEVLDSPEVSNLKLFYAQETIFSYVVVNATGKEIRGNISAISMEDAKTSLQSSGFTVLNIKEAEIGRIHPFISY